MCPAPEPPLGTVRAPRVERWGGVARVAGCQGPPRESEVLRASLVKREQMPALVETLDGVLAVVAEPLVASEHEIAYGG